MTRCLTSILALALLVMASTAGATMAAPGTSRPSATASCAMPPGPFSPTVQASNLLFSTFYGGSGVEWAHAVEVGPDGSIYVAGYTTSIDFPTTEGSYQRYLKGAEDVFVLKLTPDGTGLEWATLLGGSAQEIPWDMAVASDGRVFLTGYTFSSDFPTTLGVISRSLDGEQDAFLTALAADGGSLHYSTLLGGESNDRGYSVDLAADGTAFVAGQTESRFFPTSSRSYDTGLDGFSDVFLAHVSSDGRTLLGSTYLGGGYTELEPVLALEGGDRVWVAGSTTSTDFPTTPGTYGGTAQLGRDIFVGRLDAGLQELRASTFFGGMGNDVVRTLEIGQDGTVLMGGFSNSASFPTTSGEVQEGFQGGTDGVLLTMDADLKELQYSTYIGGSGFDAVHAAHFDAASRVRIVGYTNSTDFPTTPDAYMGSGMKVTDDHDMLYIELDQGNGSLAYSTLIGRGNGDFAMDMVLNAHDVPIIAGHTRSSDFPVLGPPIDGSYGGSGDAVVLRFSTDIDPPELTNGSITGDLETGGLVTFSVQAVDRTGVQAVQLERWYDDGDAIVENMTELGRYRLGLVLPEGARTVSYRFLAWDVLGRQNSTPPRTLGLKDTIPPWMAQDLTATMATTGDPVLLAAVPVDNWEVARAEVHYSQGDLGGTDMLEPLPSPKGAMGFTLTLPEGSVEDLDYRFVLEDGSGNHNATAWRSIRVRDDDEPVLGELDLPDRVLPGSTILLDLEASDNMAITYARVEYRFGVGTPSREDLVPPLGPRLTHRLEVPLDEMGEMTVTILAQDAEGNTATVTDLVLVEDRSPPKLLNVTYGEVATTGDPFEVSWEAEDEVRVGSMWLLYCFGEAPREDFTFVGTEYLSSATVTIDVPPDATGPLLIICCARDVFSNVNETEPVRIEVVDDDPPDADAGEPATYRHGEVPLLDARGSRDNIAIVLYEWSWTDPATGQPASETTTNATLEVVMPPGVHQVRLTVHDASGNNATATVTIEVLPVPGQDGGGVGAAVLVLAVVAAAAITSAIGVMMRRRRRGKVD